MSLVAELKKRQGRISLRKYAELLDVSHAELSRFYNGRRAISKGFALKVTNVYPDLTPIAREEVIPSSKEVAA